MSATPQKISPDFDGARAALASIGLTTARFDEERGRVYDVLRSAEAALGSARPPVPPQEGMDAMIEAAVDATGSIEARTALTVALRARGEPTLEEIVRATVEEVNRQFFDNGVIRADVDQVRARLSPPTPEVSRMEPFPLVPIPPHEVERETKAFSEKFFPHEDEDGMEPYDWREDATLCEAINHGFIDGPLDCQFEEVENAPELWYTFKNRRALTVTDPDRPGWEAFRSWALEILNGPSTPEPDPWPVYDAAAYQAERLRRASE